MFLLRNAKGEYLIEQRQERLLNGMWQFPRFEAPNTLEQLENKLGMSLSIAEEIVFKLKHQFTHMTWDISVFSVIETVSLSKKMMEDYKLEWMNLNRRDEYTLPVSMDKIYKHING